MQTEVTLPPLPEMLKLADALDEAHPLIYGPEIAARMVVAAQVLRRVEEYVQQERERCARLVESLGDPALAEIVQAIRDGVEAE